MPISLNLLKTSTFRLAAAYLFVFVLSVVGILGYVYWNTAVLLERQIDSSIRAEIATFASEYQETGLAGLLEVMDRRSELESDRVYLFTNPLGRRLAGNLSALPVAATGGSGWIDFSYAVETGQGNESRLEHRAARAYFSEIEGGYRVVIGRDVDELRQFGRIIRTSLLWAVAITLVLGLSGGLLTSRNFLRRIDQITGTSRTIMSGDLAERMPVSGTGDELDRLASNLNAMLDQIERLMTGMREVSDNIAHDLRSPLNRIRGRLNEALKSGSAEKENALRATLEDAEGMITTFNALLSIARIESGEGAGQMEAVDLVAIAQEMVELYEPAAQEAGFILQLKTAPAPPVRGSRALISQALANLLDNALKYADGGTTIRIDVRKGSDNRVLLSVLDDGPGIPEPERDSVVKRFVRLEQSRSTPGSGLGLSLVTAIARAHRGSITLGESSANPERRGLKVTIAFPTFDKG